jgi:hypothetical protein
MAYKTCEDCGSRIFEYGCVNCNERDYITMQGADRFINDTPEHKPKNEKPKNDAGENK